MFVPASQVRLATIVAIQLKFGELGNGERQRVTNPAKARLLRPVSRKGYLFKEIPAERVVLQADRAIRIANQVRHKVEILHALKKIDQVTKLPVHVYLFKVGLRQPCGIDFVSAVRTVQEPFPIPVDDFGLDRW